MTRGGPNADTYGLAPEVARLHLELTAAAEQHHPPCRGRTDWTDDDRAVRAEAAAACGHCSLLEPCGTYAQAAGEPFGVWAAVDRSEPSPRHRKRGAA